MISMPVQTKILNKPSIDLPKTWKNARVFVNFPDNETMVVKKVADSQKFIDYGIDEANWSKIQGEAAAERGQVFKQFYPELYGAK